MTFPYAFLHFYIVRPQGGAAATAALPLLATPLSKCSVIYKGRGHH